MGRRNGMNPGFFAGFSAFLLAIVAIVVGGALVAGSLTLPLLAGLNVLAGWLIIIFAVVAIIGGILMAASG